MTKSINSLFKPATYPQKTGARSKVLAEMLSRGEKLLENDPDYLEHYSHPSGRYDIGTIDLEKSHGLIQKIIKRLKKLGKREPIQPVLSGLDLILTLFR